MFGAEAPLALTAALGCGVVVLFCFFEPSVVRGASMRPALADGESIVIDRFTPRFGALSRHDVIVLEPPGAKGERYVKRIAALPGDVIERRRRELFVNGTPVLWGLEPVQRYGAFVVPEHCYYVLGDNTDASIDSRTFGVVPEARVVGRVVGR